MSDDRTYTTAEVCDMFGISKSTLFRWEREGLLPKIDRDIDGHRRYSREQIRAISKRQKVKLKRRYAQATESDDDEYLDEIQEMISLQKFFEGDEAGLSELAELPSVSSNTLHQLIKIAFEQYKPGEKTYCEIIRVLWEHSREMCGDD